MDRHFTPSSHSARWPAPDAVPAALIIDRQQSPQKQIRPRRGEAIHNLSNPGDGIPEKMMKLQNDNI
jgi:hypothetical protein